MVRLLFHRLSFSIWREENTLIAKYHSPNIGANLQNNAIGYEENHFFEIALRNVNILFRIHENVYPVCSDHMICKHKLFIIHIKQKIHLRKYDLLIVYAN